MAKDNPLPEVGETVRLEWDTTGDIPGEVEQNISGDYIVLAVDLNELIWTMFNRELKRLEMFTFDENGNYQRVAPCPEFYEDEEDEDG